MRFSFDKAACQNVRRALRKEWLLTNGLGDYASSSILCSNARKYHGLLTVNTPYGRHVLLSTFEETVSGAGREFPLSTRRHVGALSPCGHKYQEDFTLEDWPTFTYRVGDATITREIVLMQGTSTLLVRYAIRCRNKLPLLTLNLRPLLAYRNFHRLTRANPALNPYTETVANGITLSPYPGLPPLWLQVQGEFAFVPGPTWYNDVEYFTEQERGYECVEDLFMPGTVQVPLTCAEDVVLCVGTESHDDPAELWKEETARIAARRVPNERIADVLSRSGEQFCITTPAGSPSIIAGYPWFDAWGRDTLIALPGLTFYSGRTEMGLAIVRKVADSVRDGLVPNIFADGEGEAAYNSADAALWFAFAIQSYLDVHPDGLGWVRENAWPALKAIVEGYMAGPGLDIHVDDRGLLHAGSAGTQLTWMDAQVNGRPVTPRNGCPVELNALWYNTLALADSLAHKFREPEIVSTESLRELRKTFLEHFWVSRGSGYLGDVWNAGILDKSIRPNQILAASLPYPVLGEDYRTCVVECVRNNLLTPFGLRTLSPDHPDYKSRYGGTQEVRDAAYHQGTAWPWLLGHYADALLRAAWDIKGAATALLDNLLPLYAEHLADAGLGSISEIFDATPPYLPHGCIAQAWSVGECLRLLVTIQKQAPEVYGEWETRLASRMANPPIKDKAGVCRASFSSTAKGR